MRLYTNKEGIKCMKRGEYAFAWKEEFSKPGDISFTVDYKRTQKFPMRSGKEYYRIHRRTVVSFQ